MNRVNKKTIIGLSLFILLLLLSILVPLLSNQNARIINVDNRLAKASKDHLFGTDSLGRDIFVRIFIAIKNSILIAASVGIISSILGLILGLLSQSFKILDHIIMRVCEALKAIPSLLLVIFFMSINKASTLNVIIALTIVSFPNLAIIVRTKALEIKEMDYVKVKYTLGFSKIKVMINTILPSIISYVLIHISFIFSSAVLAEAALSFISSGVSSETISLGSLLFEARQIILIKPSMALIVCLFNFLLILSFNLIDSGLREN